MPILNANNITIRFQDNELADIINIRYLTNVSFDFINNLIEVSQSDSGGWLERIRGIKSVNMSFTAQLDSAVHYDLIDDIIADQLLIVRFGAIGDSTIANGYFRSVSVSGGTDDIPVISGDIEITGALAQEILTSTELLLDQDDDIITDETGDAIITINIT